MKYYSSLSPSPQPFKNVNILSSLLNKRWAVSVRSDDFKAAGMNP